MSEQTKLCCVCKKEDANWRCKGCLLLSTAFYCSKEHQKEHWHIHKQTCPNLPPLLQKLNIEDCACWDLQNLDLIRLSRTLQSGKGYVSFAISWKALLFAFTVTNKNLKMDSTLFAQLYMSTVANVHPRAFVYHVGTHLAWANLQSLKTERYQGAVLHPNDAAFEVWQVVAVHCLHYFLVRDCKTDTYVGLSLLHGVVRGKKQQWVQFALENMQVYANLVPGFSDFIQRHTTDDMWYLGPQQARNDKGEIVLLD